jgi:hypothetical protein
MVEAKRMPGADGHRPRAAVVIPSPLRYLYIAGESGNRRFVMSHSLNG